MGKHAFRSLSLSYPKKGLSAGRVPLGIAPTIKLYSAVHRLHSVVSVTSKEELAGPCPPILLLI